MLKGEKKNTIEKFIKDNDQLLSAFGVFTALTAFTASLDIESFGSILSFIFLSLSILVWLEIWGKFPNKDLSVQLIIFENLISLCSFTLVIYWVVAYRDILEKFVPLIFFLIIMSIVSSVTKKLNLFNRVFRTKDNKKKLIRYILGIVIIILVLIISLYISEVFTRIIKGAFESIEVN